MDIENILKNFIVEELLLGRDVQNLKADDPLIDSGIIDSLALLRLIPFIEENFGVSIKDGELLPDNFQSINHIKAFLAKKIGPAASG